MLFRSANKTFDLRKLDPAKDHYVGRVFDGHPEGDDIDRDTGMPWEKHEAFVVITDQGDGQAEVIGAMSVPPFAAWSLMRQVRKFFGWFRIFAERWDAKKKTKEEVTIS